MRTAAELLHKAKIKGEMFGARGCSGGCNCSPCECDPCTCGGDDLHPNPPRWRISGSHIHTGRLQGTNVAELTLFSLSLPQDEKPGTNWYEVILVDNRASDEQLAHLLSLFEPELASMPAEYRTSERPRPAVFRAPISYSNVRHEHPRLIVNCSPETLQLVRAGARISKAFAWEYDGPMAIQREF
jgi:hypothetical protein